MFRQVGGCCGKLLFWAGLRRSSRPVDLSPKRRGYRQSFVLLISRACLAQGARRAPRRRRPRSRMGRCDARSRSGRASHRRSGDQDNRDNKRFVMSTQAPGRRDMAGPVCNARRSASPHPLPPLVQPSNNFPPRRHHPTTRTGRAPPAPQPPNPAAADRSVVPVTLIRWWPESQAARSRVSSTVRCDRSDRPPGRQLAGYVLSSVAPHPAYQGKEAKRSRWPSRRRPDRHPKPDIFALPYVRTSEVGSLIGGSAGGDCILCNTSSFSHKA